MQKCRKCKAKNDVAEVAEMAEKRENYATYAIYASANFYDKEETGRRNSSSKNDLKILLSFIKGERRKRGE